MRRAFLWFALVPIVLLLYALPTLAELAFLRFQISPWLACVVFGDLLGCAVLFFAGLRKIAVLVYAAAGAVESVFLLFKILSPESVVLMTNVAPTLAVVLLILYTFSLERIGSEE